MKQIPKPRKIIDRKKLLSALDDILSWSGYSPEVQPKLFALYKEALANGWIEIRRRFEEGEQDGKQTIAAGAYLMDQLIRVVHEVATEHIYPQGVSTDADAMSVVATGGYGRTELAPQSDIDLMFVLPYKVTPRAEQIVEYILYTLWDLGLKVGHATRSADDAVRQGKADITIRTSLLESRLITGETGPFDVFQSKFRTDVVASTGAEFVDSKLRERDERHSRMGDTRYVLEPNIKDGKGGLRDLQTLIWLTAYLYDARSIDDLRLKGVLTSDDVPRFEKAEAFLWTVRCHIHFLAERPEERLTFNIQTEIAERMGYVDEPGLRGVEQFMKDYFLVAKDVGDLTRIICATLEEQQKKKRNRFRLPRFGGSQKIEGYAVDGDRLMLDPANDIEATPVMMLDLFWQAQKHELDIHPNALRQLTKSLDLIDDGLRADPAANEIFMNILTGPNPDRTLMRMNEAGVFGRFVPDFGRVVAQMQYDMYHVYTVDEHTIRAIGILHGIETGRLCDDHPVSCDVIKEVQSLPALYVAVLLHDIAKGRGGDHSEIGAEIALELCPRFGLSEWETETVSWLVRYHLLMSNTAFKRDIDDPVTVKDFVDVVQSPERLRLLLVLTVVDIRAVGPNVWNAWKANLLRELYWRSSEVLAGETPNERMGRRVEIAKSKLSDALATTPYNWSENQIAEHLELGRGPYWLAFDHGALLRHAALIHQGMKQNESLLIDITAEPEQDASEVLIYTTDHPGLFAKVAGALSLGGTGIVDAKIVTLNNGMALDTFWIQDAKEEAIEGESRTERIKRRIERALSGEAPPASELAEARAKAMPSRMNVFTVPPRVLIDNKASATHTVIEVNGRDRLGFLHDVTNAITKAGLQISSAHISTYGERVVDVFYVKDVFGLKMEQRNKIDQVRTALLDVIDIRVDSAAAAE